MNYTTMEMKNTLQGIHSRITEAEEQISVLEDKIVATIAADRINKKKRKEIGTVLETTETILNMTTLKLQEVPRRRERERT